MLVTLKNSPCDRNRPCLYLEDSIYMTAKAIFKYIGCKFIRYNEKNNRLYEVKLKDELCEYNDVCIEGN